VIEEARDLWRREHGDWKRRHAGIQAEVDRQEDRVVRLKRLLVEDEGHRPHLRAMWEDEYERAARQLEELRRRASHEMEDPDPFTETRWEEFAALCRDVLPIWQAMTTEDHHRKQLLRLLIESVVIEMADAERIKLRIEWPDGTNATPIEILRSPYFHRIIWDLHQSKQTVDQIVAALAEIGARTQQGRSWSRETVQRTILVLKEKQAKGR